MKEQNYCALYIKDIDSKLWKIVANLKDVRLFAKNIRIKNDTERIINEVLLYYKAKEVSEIYPVQRGACLIDRNEKKIISIYSDYLGNFEWNCSAEKIRKAWQEVSESGWCIDYEDLMLRMSSSGVFDIQEEYQMLEALKNNYILLSSDNAKYPQTMEECNRFISTLTGSVDLSGEKNRIKLKNKSDDWQYKTLNLKEQWLGMEGLFLNNPMPWESNKTMRWSEEVLENYMLKKSGIIDVETTQKRLDFLKHLKANIEAQREAKILSEILEEKDQTKESKKEEAVLSDADGVAKVLPFLVSDGEQVVEKGRGRSGRL